MIKGIKVADIEEVDKKDVFNNFTGTKAFLICFYSFQ